MFHISRAFHQIRAQAVAERRRRGWSEYDYAALSVLGREDGKTVAEIAALSNFPGRQVTPEVIAGLAERGLVGRAAPVRPDTPVAADRPRRQSVIEIIAIIKASEAHALRDFDFSEVQTLIQLLRRLGGGVEPGGPPAAAGGEGVARPAPLQEMRLVLRHLRRVPESPSCRVRGLRSRSRGCGPDRSGTRSRPRCLCR